MKKIYSTFLLVSTILFLFSTPLIAQTGIKSIEAPGGYGQHVQCVDITAAELEKELSAMNTGNRDNSKSKISSFDPGGKMVESTNPYTDNLGITFDQPISLDIDRTSDAPDGYELPGSSLVFRSDHGPSDRKYHQLE